MKKWALIALIAVVPACVSPPVPQAPRPDPAAIPSTSVAPGRGNRSPYVVFGKSYEVMPSSLGYLEIGIASWYGRKFHGRLTSNGETYDMFQLTAAHKALPLPTVARVTNLDNGRKVIVRVNDRGPFHDDRLIDLSYQTALKLGFADKGTAPVVVEALDEINYPDLVKGPLAHQSFYLQVGAFSSRAGATSLLQNVEHVIESTDFAHVDVRILESELDDERFLHKVWVGPMRTESERDDVAKLVEAAKLGVPLRVTVD